MKRRYTFYVTFEAVVETDAEDEFDAQAVLEESGIMFDVFDAETYELVDVEEVTPKKIQPPATQG